MFTKACNGGNITFLHDSAVCIRCMAVIHFYNIVKKKKSAAITIRRGRICKKLSLTSFLEQLPSENADSVPVDSLSKKDKSRKNSPKSKESLNVDKPLKKELSSPTTTALKEPKLGTLKRKRWNYEKLKTNDNYEDDLFSDTKFYRFHNLIEEESNSDESGKIPTPQWSISLSPRNLSDSPTYEDFYSPEELSTIRKDAEEYQYRRSKRRNIKFSEKPDIPRPTKDTSNDTTKTLEAACKVLMRVKAEQDCDEDSDDYYFSDVGEDSL